MPTPEEIKEARKSAGLTQKQAAELIGYTLRAWEDWEQGQRSMRPIVFESFQRAAKLKGKRK